MPDAPSARPSRAVCPRCARPLRACLCAFALPCANRLPVLVLQHPREAGQAKNSVRLLRLALADCTVQVGEVFDTQGLAGWLGLEAAQGAVDAGPADGGGGCGGSSLLLFPATPAAPAPARQPVATTAPMALSVPVSPTPPCGGAAHDPRSALPRPSRLVLLDGTWRQARALLRANPLLQGLPRWALPDPPPSRYAIRRAHRPGQRSTLEAACLALGLLEGRPAHYAPLLDAFAAWVAAEQARAQGSGPVLSPAPPAPRR